jgi:hypothetical protein
MFTASAQAQLGTRPMQGPSRPTTSPYLSLLNGSGRSGGLNYFTQVRPIRQFRASEQSLRQDIASLEQSGGEPVTYDEFGQALIPESGHSTTFMNQNGYFGTGPSTSVSSQGTPSGASSRGPALRGPRPNVPQSGTAVMNRMRRQPSVPGVGTY